MQKVLDELERPKLYRKRAWENLQEFRWVLKDATATELPPAERKTIDLEGRIVKDGTRTALTDLVHAIRQYRAPCGIKPAHSLQGIGLRSRRP